MLAVAVGVAMRDDDQWLSFGIDAGAMERVAAYYIDVGRKVFLEGGNFGCFAGRLSTNYSALLGS